MPHENPAATLSDIKSKLRALLIEPCTDREFVEWLKSYAQRANEILNPVHVPLQPTVRDFISANRGLSNSQKVVDFCESHKLVLPHGEFWYALNPDNRPARISGFDGNGNKIDPTVGYPRITNGILVYLERADGTLFLGHRDYLIWQRKPREIASQESTDSLTNLTTTSSIKPTSKELATAEQLVNIGDLSLFNEKFTAVMGKPLGFELSDDREADIIKVACALHSYLGKMTETTLV